MKPQKYNYEQRIKKRIEEALEKSGKTKSQVVKGVHECIVQEMINNQPVTISYLAKTFPHLKEGSIRSQLSRAAKQGFLRFGPEWARGPNLRYYYLSYDVWFELTGSPPK